jgi:lysyl-tRNA synthetase class 2
MDAAHLERMRRRAAVITAVRSFFDAQGFLEVDTPVALSAPAPELHIEAPPVTLRAAAPERRFLQSSPELPMKRLLAAGLPRIYQIAPVFRDGDYGPLHRPEFRLLEWYRRDEPWTALLDDCEGLLRTAAAAAGHGPRFTYGDRRVDLDGPFRRVTMDEAFRSTVGFSILDALEPAALAAYLDARGIARDPTDGWDDLFHRIFLTSVEPTLANDERPVFLTGYPAPLAALARLAPDDPRVSERFELYVGGMELANGFGELTDPREQRIRFERDRDLRRARGLSDYPIDERFLAALGELRSAAGIALGVDRLLMLLLNVQTVDGASFIPWSET